MTMSEYKLLDTGVFNVFIDKQGEFVKEYNAIKEEYDSIVSDLTDIWRGRGADAFRSDANTVKSNIVGIGDMLRTMCDMLIDCRDVFHECDTAVGNSNREAAEQK
jgi:uncharacterized protein YukE